MAAIFVLKMLFCQFTLLFSLCYERLTGICACCSCRIRFLKTCHLFTASPVYTTQLLSDGFVIAFGVIKHLCSLTHRPVKVHLPRNHAMVTTF